MALQSFPFAPPPSGAFRFQPTVDGSVYLGLVTWNVFGQRWYLNLYDGSGTRRLTRPLVGSSDGFDVDLAAGVFDDPIVFRESSQTILVG